MSFRICSKNVMNVTFLSNLKKKIYLDPKNEDIVKILWYFVVFLDFFFNIIKLGEPKFTVSHTKSILIFSQLGAACALHVQPMLVNIKRPNFDVALLVNIMITFFQVPISLTSKVFYG